MSLPQTFDNPDDYFISATLFFQKYEYLFNFPNTDILVMNILDRIDVTNLEDLNIFEKGFDLKSVKESNGFLKEFFETLQRFEVHYDEIIEINDLNDKNNMPLGPKKKHEILYLAKEIKNICAENGCDVVVDFGSGLGYLDQLIYETTNMKVIGIECNENNYVGAKKRQRKYHVDSCQNVKYIKHTISENSDETIEEYLIDKFGSLSEFCIAGLHACADLTVIGLNLFSKMSYAKSLILMPCCYHKMGTEGGRFKNFPKSRCLREIFERDEASDCMKVPFLRLAAQPPTRECDSLQDIVFNLLARGTLQLYAKRHNCKLKRNKRKAVRTKTIQKDFRDYFQNAVTGFTLIDENQDSVNGTQTEIDYEEAHRIWRETQCLTTQAAIFVLLQSYLQPVIENFILYDRIVYLKENGLENSYCKKVFNEKLSPRCLALISIK